MAGFDPVQLQKESECMAAMNNRMTEQEKQHKEIVERLESRVQWYTENQEMLDNDEETLRKQEERIDELTSQLHRFEMDNKTNQQWKKTEARLKKKIRELEKHVKDADENMRKRNPDSIAAIVRAAGPDEETEKELSQLRQKADASQRMLERREKEWERRLRAQRQEVDKLRLRLKSSISEDKNDSKSPVSTKSKSGGGRPLSARNSTTRNNNSNNNKTSNTSTNGKCENCEKTRSFYRMKIEEIQRKFEKQISQNKRNDSSSIASSSQLPPKQSTTTAVSNSDLNKLRDENSFLRKQILDLESKRSSPILPTSQIISHVDDTCETPRSSVNDSPISPDERPIRPDHSVASRHLESERQFKEAKKNVEKELQDALLKQKEKELEILHEQLKSAQSSVPLVKFEKIQEEVTSLTTKLALSESTIQRLNAEIEEAKKSLKKPRTADDVKFADLEADIQEARNMFQVERQSLKCQVEMLKTQLEAKEDEFKDKLEIQLRKHEREMILQKENHESLIQQKEIALIKFKQQLEIIMKEQLEREKEAEMQKENNNYQQQQQQLFLTNSYLPSQNSPQNNNNSIHDTPKKARNKVPQPQSQSPFQPQRVPLSFRSDKTGKQVHSNQVPNSNQLIHLDENATADDILRIFTQVPLPNFNGSSPLRPKTTPSRGNSTSSDDINSRAHSLSPRKPLNSATSNTNTPPPKTPMELPHSVRSGKPSPSNAGSPTPSLRNNNSNGIHRHGGLPQTARKPYRKPEGTARVNSHNRRSVSSANSSQNRRNIPASNASTNNAVRGISTRR